MIKVQYAALAAAVMVLSACASTPDTETSAAEQPVFSEAEKAAMTADEKAEVYNQQAEEEDRVYCRKEVVTGSHRKRTVCRTASEIKRQSQSAQDALWGARKGGAQDPGGTN